MNTWLADLVYALGTGSTSMSYSEYTPFGSVSLWINICYQNGTYSETLIIGLLLGQAKGGQTGKVVTFKRPPRGSMNFLFTKLVNLVPLQQSHHKPMGMYDDDLMHTVSILVICLNIGKLKRDVQNVGQVVRVSGGHTPRFHSTLSVIGQFRFGIGIGINAVSTSMEEWVLSSMMLWIDYLSSNWNQNRPCPELELKSINSSLKSNSVVSPHRI